MKKLLMKIKLSTALLLFLSLLINCTGKYNLEQMAGEKSSDVNVIINPASKLSNIVLSAGTLSPAFDSSVFNYSSSVPQTITSLTLIPITSDSSAVIRVNGNGYDSIVQAGVSSGSIPLHAGSNLITINVSSPNTTLINTYIIMVTQYSNNCLLSGLTIANGAQNLTLSPVFSSAIFTNYSLSLPYSISSITITPIPSNINSTIKINGTAISYGSSYTLSNLVVGNNDKISIVVTSQDGTANNEYSIDTVLRKSNNANLSGLSLSIGTLSPAFSPSVTSYSLTVNAEFIKVTPTLEDLTASSLKVNGVDVVSGAQSNTITLSVGTNIITIAVKAQDTSIVKNYYITVTYQPPLLSSLIVSSGSLPPVFSSSVYSYNMNINYATSGITLTPTAAFANSSIKINGIAVNSGSASGLISMNIGINVLSVVVTDQDGITTRTYTINCNRDFYLVSTLAGDGTYGFQDSTDSTGATAIFNWPAGIAVYGPYLYVADSLNNRIRRVLKSTGATTTFAGTGSSAWVDDAGGISGNTATFYQPADITTDGTYLYVADKWNNRIRKINIITGYVSTLAGSSTSSWVDDTGGISGSAATFLWPEGICTDGVNLYVSDTGHNRIRKIVISTGIVSSIAGSGNSAFADGVGVNASFVKPTGIATDGTYIYVSDTSGHRIRKITISNNYVSTLAGSGNSAYLDGTGSAASFKWPAGLYLDSIGKYLYVADSGNNRIRRVDTGTGEVFTVAGNGSLGAVNGAGTSASFESPTGLASDGTSLFVGDELNNRIRKIQ